MSTGHPPVPYTEFVRVEQERDHWRNNCFHMQEERDQWRTRCLQAEKQLAQENTFWQSPLFKPAEKLLIRELQRQVNDPNRHRDEDDFTQICYETAARHMGMSTNTPKLKLQAVLHQCPDFPIETREREEPNPKGKGTIPRLYVKTKTNLIAATPTLTLAQKIKQGGNQYECQRCGSANVMIKRRLHCNDCGHETDLEPTFPNGKLKQNSGKSGRTNLVLDHDTNDRTDTQDETGKSGRTNLVLDHDVSDHTDTQDETSKSGRTNLVLDHNELTPPENFLTTDEQLVGVVIKPLTPLNADKLSDEGEGLTEAESCEITSAAELLLAIAGEHDTHIVMPRTYASKYLEVKRPLALFDLVDHLKAGEARGALCSYQDGSTRALCFDTDEEDEWEAWRRVSRKLVQAGYIVIFEESPAGRGGHLWIIFDGLVDAAAARVAVLQVAPELADCKEYWPGPQEATSWNRVRLPGGFYARYGRHVEHPVKAWCKLVNVATGESSSDGRSAARLLLSSLTPAAVVKAEPVITAEPMSEIHTQDEQLQAGAVALSTFSGEDNVPFTTQDEQVEAPIVESAAAAPLPLPKVDAQWERNYGKVEKTTCWFAIMPEVAARWFNERHRLEEIRPRETNGMALSPNGNERTASTNYRGTPDGERYTDHSMHGRRSDGTRDSGDALELAAKVEGKSKSAFLSGVICEMIREGKAALESTAAAGQPLPGWFEDPECIITPAGRRKYGELLAESEARKPSVPPTPATVVEPAPAAPVGMEFPTAAAVTKRIEESVMRLEGPSQGETPTEIEPEHDASIPLSPDQDEPDALACLVEEQKTGLVEGMRVDTPAGLATVRMVMYFENLNVPRWRCAVRTDAVQPDTTRFAVFDVTQIQPISQHTIFSL